MPLGPPSANHTAAHQPDRVELITLQRQHSMTAEAFRTVLTSILFSGENGGRPRVLVMTSAGPTEEHVMRQSGRPSSRRRSTPSLARLTA